MTSLPPQPQKISQALYHATHLVTADEIDRQGHVNNLRHLAWMQEIAIEHSRAVGWNGDRYRAENLAWVVRAHAIEYHRPAYLDDAILIETWISEMRKTGCTRQYRLRLEPTGELIALASTRWVLTDRIRKVPIRIPPHLAEAFIVLPQSADERQRSGSPS